MQLRPYQNDLVEQVRQAWREGYKAPCIVLGCGGGKSCIVAEIARRTTWNGKRVLFLVHRRELVDQIFRTFVRWGVLMDLCQIGMVQTFTRRLKKLPKPALIITDENHHSLAQSYKRIYEHFSDVPRVGVTATPVRLNGDGLGDVNDKLIIGVSTKWLIEHNCLAPYDYYAPSVADLTGLHTKMGEYVTADIEKAMIKNTVFGDVIKYYKQLADGKKAVCYCSSVKHSLATAKAFCDAGISASHIDGATPKAQREQIIADFRNGKITILCNVDLISEGFDVPDCECTILLRPTHSLTLYIQQSMRCMRYKPNKRAVIIDHVGNYARHGRSRRKRSGNVPNVSLHFQHRRQGRKPCVRIAVMLSRQPKEPLKPIPQQSSLRLRDSSLISAHPTIATAMRTCLHTQKATATKQAGHIFRHEREV